jgi:hypothetical protein
MPTGSTRSATGCHTSAFEEKTNNPYKQGNNETKINTVNDIHRKAHCISQNVRCLSRAKISLQKLCHGCHTPLSHTSVLSFSLSPLVSSGCGSP